MKTLIKELKFYFLSAESLYFAWHLISFNPTENLHAIVHTFAFPMISSVVRVAAEVTCLAAADVRPFSVVAVGHLVAIMQVLFALIDILKLFTDNIRLQTAKILLGSRCFWL